MKTDISAQRRLAIIAQSDRLNKIAFARLGDHNEGRLMVHGVLARALGDESPLSAARALDAALQLALNANSEACRRP